MLPSQIELLDPRELLSIKVGRQVSSIAAASNYILVADEALLLNVCLDRLYHLLSECAEPRDEGFILSILHLRVWC
jgi:hypothetical protein